jgi:hypothetical protein
VFKSSADELTTAMTRLSRQGGGGFGPGYGPSRPVTGPMNRFGFNTYRNMTSSYGRGHVGRGWPCHVVLIYGFTAVTGANGQSDWF